MRITPSRILILAVLILVVAVVLPGARQYLTVKACLETAIISSSGDVFCPQGSERLPVRAVQWVRVPTVASTVTAFFVAVVVILLFTFRDRRTGSRVAG
jgi:hypothetical protein